MAIPSLVLIEDDPAQARLIRDVLHHQQTARILGAFPSGQQFFAWLAAQAPPPPIDLVFLDMRLLGESGYDVLPTIRQHPALTQVRVVAVTANIMAADVAHMQQAGFDGFIGKPIDPFTLSFAIDRVMRGIPLWDPA